MTDTIILEMDDLRAVAAYAAECAMEALGIFEQANPGDMRLRDAIDAARAFASGGKRVEALRDVSWAALRAAQDADNPVVSQQRVLQWRRRRRPIFTRWLRRRRSSISWALPRMRPARSNWRPETRPTSVTGTLRVLPGRLARGCLTSSGAVRPANGWWASG